MTDGGPGPAASAVVSVLLERGLTLAVAESLTGGLLSAEIVRVPGVSQVFLGGVVTYNTALKESLLGVDHTLLAEHGPVHPEVAAQMALGVRSRMAVDGRAADVGLSTTGVAGPGPQDGQAAGTVYIGISIGKSTRTLKLCLEGTRDTIRESVVSELLAEVELQLAHTSW